MTYTALGRLVPILLLASFGAVAGLASGCGSGGGANRTVPGPTLASTEPETAFAPGGAALTIRGTGFTANDAGSTRVTVGGVPASDVEVLDDTTLLCALPAGPVGPADVEIANANGSAAIAEGITYYAFPPSFPTADARVDPDDPDTQGVGAPRICCEGSNVYMVWFQYRDLGQDIYFSHSQDGGTTWPAEAIRLDTGTPGAARSSAPVIACEGPSVYVAWVDLRNGDSDIYFNRSTDGGATWLTTDVRIDTASPGGSSSIDPRIGCAGSNVYVAWADNRNGRWDVRFNRSTDQGTTWQTADTRLDTDAPGAADSDTLEMCCDGSNVYVTWEEARNGRDDVYFNGSRDGGATWLAADVRLDTDTLGAAGSNQPSIACDEARVYVVWKDKRYGEDDICLNTSPDGGATWLAVDIRVGTDSPGAADSQSPEVSCDGANVYVAWEDVRNGIPEIYVNRSQDAAVTWLPADIRLDTDDPVAGRSFSPQICCDGANVYVTWSDDRNGFRDIFLNASRDGGATWQATDTRLDTDAPGAASSNIPRACCDGATVYVMWVDGRGGGDDHAYMTASRPR